MGSFHEYYNNPDKKAPYLTIFVGGNHEASNVLDANYYGGWITENVFYIGRAGVINHRGLRIGGVSGIFNETVYYKGHFENNLKSSKSIYQVREFEIAKLSNVRAFINISLLVI